MLSRGILVVSLLGLASAPGCDGCDPSGFVDAAVPDAPTYGQLSLTWTLTDLDGKPITCEQISGTTVTLLVRPRAGAGGTTASFSCGNSPSTTQLFPSGEYNVTIQLNGAAGALVTLPDQIGVKISDHATTPLAPVVFQVDPQGSFALSLATSATSNCQPAPTGADISTMTITLVNSAGSCVPVTLLRKRGSAPPTTYTVSCGSPATSTCIENDETLSPMAPIASGPYTIHIRGKVGAVECWTNDDMLVVPPRGGVLTSTLRLANGCPAAR